MLMGSVLGPVGAIGGAIAGAVVGGRAGAAASDAACDAVEASADDVCDRCQEQSAKRPGHGNWGGGRLGSVDEPSASSGISSSSTAYAPAEPSIGDRVGEAASATGKTLGRAASATGETLSRGWSSLSNSLSQTFGNSEEPTPKAAGRSSDAIPFSGSGHVLGSRETDKPARPISRLVGGPAPGSSAAA